MMMMTIKQINQSIIIIVNLFNFEQVLSQILINFIFSKSVQELPMRKIMFLGESGTGKTSFISYFLHKHTFEANHYPTPGIEVGVRGFQFDVYNQDGSLAPQKNLASIQFWDTAGKHSMHDEVCLKYYREMDDFIIMIDCSNENTLKSVNYWSQKIKTICGSSSGYGLGVFANKSDLQKQFSRRDFERMYPHIHFYREVSLKQQQPQKQKNSQTQEAFYDFIKLVVYSNNLPRIIQQQQPANLPVCQQCTIM